MKKENADIFAVFLLHFRRILPAEKFVKIP